MKQSMREKREQKQLAVRLPLEVHAKLTAIAERERRSLNSQIVRLIEEKSA